MARNQFQPRHYRRAPPAPSPSTTTGPMESPSIPPPVGPRAASGYHTSPSPGVQNQVPTIQPGPAHGPAAHPCFARESPNTPRGDPVGGYLDPPTAAALSSRHSPMAPRFNTDPFRPIEPDQSQLDGPTDGFFPPLGPASAPARAHDEQPVAVIEHRFKNGSVLRVSAHSLESMTMALTHIWRLNDEIGQGNSAEHLEEPKQASSSSGAQNQEAK